MSPPFPDRWSGLPALPAGVGTWWRIVIDNQEGDDPFFTPDEDLVFGDAFDILLALDHRDWMWRSS